MTSDVSSLLVAIFSIISKSSLFDTLYFEFLKEESYKFKNSHPIKNNIVVTLKTKIANDHNKTHVYAINDDDISFEDLLKLMPEISEPASGYVVKDLIEDVESDKKLLAIIETDNGQKFYKVGDTLDNGFVIQFISLENVTVDISNGTKKYRLTLADIEKLI